MNVIDRNPKLAAAAFFLFVVGITIVVLSTLAHASADPVATATTATSDLWTLVQTHGPLGVGLIAYGVLAKFLAENKEKHWLKEGRALSIATAISMVAGALALWRFSGGGLEAVLEAVIGGIALIVKPTVNGAPAPSAAA